MNTHTNYRGKIMQHNGDANSFFYKTLKANEKLHQYFWGPNKNVKDGGF